MAEPVQTNLSDWEQFDLSDNILQAIDDYTDIEGPTPFQTQSIPQILTGRNLIEQAPSGSGKTLAFLCGALQLCESSINKKCPQVIVLSNTPELSIQNFEVFKKLNKYTNFTCGIVLPPDSSNEDLPPANKRSQFIFGTPSSVVMGIKSKKWLVNKLQVLILDDADIIIDQNEEDLTNLFGSSKMPKLLPENIQILLFANAYSPKHISTIKCLANSLFIYDRFTNKNNQNDQENHNQNDQNTPPEKETNNNSANDSENKRLNNQKATSNDQKIASKDQKNAKEDNQIEKTIEEIEQENTLHDIYVYEHYDSFLPFAENEAILFDLEKYGPLPECNDESSNKDYIQAIKNLHQRNNLLKAEIQRRKKELGIKSHSSNKI